MAEKVRRKREGELAAGVYRSESRKQWKDFKAEFEVKISAGMVPSTKRITSDALKHFERLVKPGKMQSITTRTIDEYVSKRRVERGKKRGSKVSPATINKELRHLKAALRIAGEWKYLPEIPTIRMLREPEKLPRYIPPEHFAAIYGKCDVATLPDDQNYPAGDWWRAMLTFAYMTGWRLMEPLSLNRTDLDMEAGMATTRHRDNKGKRDEVVPLHPIVIEHLTKLAGFGPVVFPWNYDRAKLWKVFHEIQRAAEIHLPCTDAEDHECTDACHVYGFHDCRRAFATLNAETLSANAMQKLMRHRSYQTTQRYINMAGQLKGAVETLHVPDVLKVGIG